MAFESPSDVTQLTQELRLATTMTGGVSLAIWMAGVAREINLLAQASRWRRMGGTFPTDNPLTDASGAASLKLYAALIDLLDVVVDVDILSGTSAGGINAALLASSRVTGSDLGGLRDLWLDLGALTDLLRDPTDKNTPSLLYGDERMFTVLANELPKLTKGPFPPKGDPRPSTTLYVTTTLLTGETSRFTDAFGTLVQDVDRRGVFTFTEKELANEDKKTYSALALAARSSASFPLAFEPSFVPFREEAPEKGDLPARPPMEAYANITRPHWVADGGLLDNQPIDLLLTRIFDRTANRPVRRVLLFVVPSSGPAPDMTEAAPLDDVNEPLGLGEGLLKDLAAVTTQSIAADLRAIRAHQDRMEARTDTRLRLAELAGRLREGSRLLTTSLLEDYRTREATKQAHALTSALLRQLSTWPPASNGSNESIPKQWEPNLRIGGDAEQVCRQAINDSLLHEWPKSLPEKTAELAQYGQAALDLAKGCAISVVQAAYQLAASQTTDMAALAELTQQIHEACKPPRASNGQADQPAVASDGEADEPHARPDMGELAHAVCTDEKVREGSLDNAAVRLADAYLGLSEVRAKAWDDLGRALIENFDTLKRLAASHSSDPPGLEGSLLQQNSVAANQLKTYLHYLEPAAHPKSPEANARMACKLFDLATAQRAMLPAEADIEQSLELVQVSADTRSLLAPKFRTAEEKLTGMQLHHFGAFYKRSWRANDWMWGRLDGAGWLVHVVLDPRRVRQIVDRECGPIVERRQKGAQWFLDQLKVLGAPEFPESGYPLPPAADGSKRSLTECMLREEELAFLDDDRKPMPPSIPLTALWLAQVWQQRVLDEELDELANAVVNPPSGIARDWSPARSRTWAENVLAKKDGTKYAFLKKNPVAEETFSTDKGSPLMAQTITKAAATASAAVGSVRQMPGVLKPPLITLQTLALGGYRVVTLTKGTPRSEIIAGAWLLVLGVAGAIQNATLLGFGGLVLAATGGYLIVLGTWQSSSRPGTLPGSNDAETQPTIRQRLSRVLLPLLSATLVGAVLSLATPVVRRKLFGTSQTDSGLVGTHVYWLGAEWWHPLLVVGAIALTITLIGIAAARPRRRRRKTSDQAAGMPQQPREQ